MPGTLEALHALSLKLWGLFFLALKPWTWGPGVWVGPPAFQGILHSQDIPANI